MQKKCSKSTNNLEKKRNQSRNPENIRKMWTFLDFLNFFLNFSCDVVVDLDPRLTETVSRLVRIVNQTCEIYAQNSPFWSIFFRFLTIFFVFWRFFDDFVNIFGVFLGKIVEKSAKIAKIVKKRTKIDENFARN